MKPKADPDALAKLQKERDELVEHLQRLQAEFDNFRKRMTRDQQVHQAQATERLLADILPVIDNLHLAITHAKDDQGSIRGEDLLTGVLLIGEQLERLLADNDITIMQTDGATFTPTHHEALLIQEREGATPGTIIQTLQRGYLRGERVLRPAKVMVAK